MMCELAHGAVQSRIWGAMEALHVAAFIVRKGFWGFLVCFNKEP